MPRQKQTPEYRRLTKAESLRLGIKPSSKRYVLNSVKRPSKRTKTFSQRTAVQAKLGTTKEARTAIRRRGEPQTRDGAPVENPNYSDYRNVKPRDFPRLLDIIGNRYFQLFFFTSNVDFGRYKEDFFNEEQRFESTAMSHGRESLEAAFRQLQGPNGLHGFSFNKDAINHSGLIEPDNMWVRIYKEGYIRPSPNRPKETRKRKLR
jgi:hypothetical protein